MNSEFIHLHVHTEYSPLDAPVRLDRLVDTAKAMGFKALAITDHGTVSGWVKFSQLCQKEDKKKGLGPIKPILGIEAYFTHDVNKRESRDDNFHLVLLAKDDLGVRNIFKLSELAWTQGQYYDPRVDWKMLEAHAGGIVCLSACVSGPLGETLLRHGPEQARDVAKRFKALFGDDFYVELQHHALDVEDKVYPALAKIAADLGIKVVATNDVHYITMSEASVQEAMMAVSMKKCLKDPDRVRHSTNQMYLKSADEMAEAFGADRAAMVSTLEVAAKCNGQLKFGKAQLPSIDLPAPFKTDLEYLEHLAREGMRKLGLEGKPAYEARFRLEINVIRKLREKGNQFDRYFLVVWDYVNYAWSHGIRVGVGRGSGVGSLILYCLRITGLDPLPYDLLFERFLDENRNKMPDIDIDFDAERGQEVYEYACKKYGKDHVARIGTFSTYHVAAALKAALKACDVGGTWDQEQHRKNTIEADKRRKNKKSPGRKEAARDETAWLANEVTKQLPRDPSSGRPSAFCTFNKATYDEKPDKMKYVYAAEAFQDLKLRYPEAFGLAERFEGLIEKRGIHAAGVLITQEPLINLCPQHMVGDVHGGRYLGKAPATAFEMNDIEKLGGVKFDFLRTKALSAITRAVRSIKEVRGEDIPIDFLVPNDAKVFDMFARGDTLAIFQFEGDGITKLLRDMKPTCFEDIIAANALFRPGPIENIPTYLNRRQGREQVSVPVQGLEPILRNTCGILVYQEQVIRATRALAGFTGSEGDRVREAMGKKKVDILNEMEPKFLAGCAKLQSCSQEMAQKIWSTMKGFGEYAFNKSIDESCVIPLAGGGQKRLKDMNEGDWIWCFDGQAMVAAEVAAVHDHGMLEGVEITFDDGHKEVCSINHKFLTAEGMLPLHEILLKDIGIISHEEETEPMLLRTEVRGKGRDAQASNCVSHSKRSNKGYPQEDSPQEYPEGRQVQQGKSRRFEPENQRGACEASVYSRGEGQKIRNDATSKCQIQGAIQQDKVGECQAHCFSTRGHKASLGEACEVASGTSRRVQGDNQKSPGVSKTQQSRDVVVREHSS